jgi:hypothetical protein
MINGIGHIGDDPRVTGPRQKNVERSGATFSVESVAPPAPVPMAPPPEVLAALDTAARVLHGLDDRGDELRLSVEQDGAVRATFQPVDGGVQDLTHRQLLDLLAGR